MNEFRQIKASAGSGKTYTLTSSFLSLLAGHRDFENPNWNAQDILRRYAWESETFRWRKAPYEIYKK